MGCELSKLAGGGGGSKSNDIGPSEPPPPAAPDPRLPLTARQKYTMIASWKGISRAMQPTGVCMFVRYVFPVFIIIISNCIDCMEFFCYLILFTDIVVIQLSLN